MLLHLISLVNDENYNINNLLLGANTCESTNNVYFYSDSDNTYHYVNHFDQ